MPALDRERQSPVHWGAGCSPEVPGPRNNRENTAAGSDRENSEAMERFAEKDAHNWGTFAALFQPLYCRPGKL